MQKAIDDLDDSKDPGPMTITVQFIKYNAQILTPILAKLFNTILRTSTIPVEWKESFILPIPKKGAVNDIGNYRGIAIQSVIPKILDKLITALLQRHLSTIIPTQQHGFVQHKGTTTNLVEMS